MARSIIILAVLATIFGLAWSQGNVPQHIVLSLGGDESIMAVTFITKYPPVESCIAWWVNGSAPESGLSYCGTTRTQYSTFLYPSHFQLPSISNKTDYITVMEMYNLEPYTAYAYHVSSDNEKHWSDTYVFRTLPSDNDPIVFAVYGDLGAQARALKTAPNGAPNGTWTLPYIANNHMVDFIMHYGDLAYNLCTKLGAVGNAFMDAIQTVTAQIPYMVTIGNHETFGQNLVAEIADTRDLIGNSMPYYTNWFAGQRAVAVASGGDSDYMTWYSYDVGTRLHVIVMSTEVVCSNELYNGANLATDHFIAQYNWLENDLRELNDTYPGNNRPWVIVFGHRQMYNGRLSYFHSAVLRYGFQCANKDCSNLLWNQACNPVLPNGCAYSIEFLFNQYRVDLVIAGHQHMYQRMLPMAYTGSTTTAEYQEMPNTDNYEDPRYPVYIVAGAPGDNPGLSTDSLKSETCLELTLLDSSESSEETTTGVSSPEGSTTGHKKTHVKLEFEMDVSEDAEVHLDLELDIEKRRLRAAETMCQTSNTAPNVVCQTEPLDCLKHKFPSPEFCTNRSVLIRSFSQIEITDTSSLTFTQYETPTMAVIDTFTITKTGRGIRPHPTTSMQTKYIAYANPLDKDDIWGNCNQ